VNFTGFYDKHPTDDNVFANPVPYINMTVYQNQSNSLTWNATFHEVSSSEAGYVLGLSYNTFRAGFLIPTNILNEIPQMAYMQDTPDWAACTVNVEEYYDIMKIEFLQDSTWQNTSLIYDKDTGVLVWAKIETVSFFGSADFEIQLDGYQLLFRDINPLYSQDLDLDKTYMYNVTYWESGEIISYWDYNWADQGDINASTGGQIHVNFTGFYDKHPTDDNVFANPVPYINMTVYQNQSNTLAFNSTFSNVSSSEAGYVLGICYNQFRAGFLVPITFLNLIKLYAKEQDTPDWAACAVNIEEYDFIMKIEFLQDSTWQNSSLIYDKKTGLLVWAKIQTVSFFGSADFEIFLDGYDLNFQKTQNYDQSVTAGFENVEIYVGNLEQESSVYVGEYQVNTRNPFIKIVVEVDSSNWDLDIVLKDAYNNNIRKLEEGTNGTSIFWAVFDSSLSNIVNIYLNGDFSPNSAASQSQSGSNYYIQAGSSNKYKNYVPLSLIDDDNDDENHKQKSISSYPFTIFMMIFAVTSLICLVIIRKRTKK